MPDQEIIEKHLQSYIADLENLRKHKNVETQKRKTLKVKRKK